VFFVLDEALCWPNSWLLISGKSATKGSDPGSLGRDPHPAERSAESLHFSKK